LKSEISRLDHIAIAVKDLEEAIDFFQKSVGLQVSHIEDILDQKAKVGFIPLGETNLELVQPTSQDTGLAKFLDRTGGGLHHICLEVKNIVEALKLYKDSGIELIDDQPRTGAHNKKIAFLHPKSTKGVLIELCQYPHE
jgi:methylmalonyl-CoA epimerase